MRVIAIVAALWILIAAPSVYGDTPMSPWGDFPMANLPPSIQGDSGFYEMGRAIAAEPGFPRDGSDVEKARYVHSRLPDIAMSILPSYFAHISRARPAQEGVVLEEVEWNHGT